MERGNDPGRLRPSWWDVPVILGVLALAVFSLPRGTGQAAEAVVVRCGGTEAERFSPDALCAAPRRYTHNGYTLTLTAEETEGGIALRVAEADCPGQDCVHTGAISLAGESIVCLPAEVTVTLVGGSGRDGVDAVTG